MSRPYRSYSTEFKLAVVHAYLNGEGGFKAIARQHGICHALVILWVRKFQRGELTEELDQAEKVHEYEAKIATLERKVGQLVMEIELLKKRGPTLPNGEPLSIVSGPQPSPSQKGAA
jgi:transposase-like protein